VLDFRCARTGSALKLPRQPALGLIRGVPRRRSWVTIALPPLRIGRKSPHAPVLRCRFRGDLTASTTVSAPFRYPSIAPLASDVRASVNEVTSQPSSEEVLRHCAVLYRVIDYSNYLDPGDLLEITLSTCLQVVFGHAKAVVDPPQPPPALRARVNRRLCSSLRPPAIIAAATDAPSKTRTADSMSPNRSAGEWGWPTQHVTLRPNIVRAHRCSYAGCVNGCNWKTVRVRRPRQFNHLMKASGVSRNLECTLDGHPCTRQSTAPRPSPVSLEIRRSDELAVPQHHWCAPSTWSAIVVRAKRRRLGRLWTAARIAES
jgi:hypothetical protein